MAFFKTYPIKKYSHFSCGCRLVSGSAIARSAVYHRHCISSYITGQHKSLPSGLLHGKIVVCGNFSLCDIAWLRENIFYLRRAGVTLASPVVTGGFGGISPPKQSSKSPKLKFET